MKLRLIITAVLFVLAVLFYIGAGLIALGTLFVALTDPQFDRYARQIGLIIVFIILGLIFSGLCDKSAPS